MMSWNQVTIDVPDDLVDTIAMKANAARRGVGEHAREQDGGVRDAADDLAGIGQATSILGGDRKSVV